MIKKRFLKSRPVCKVTFYLPAAVKAETVHLVGDFNDWDEKATPMAHLKDGRFAVELELETGKEYQFRYLVDQNRMAQRLGSR